MSVQPEEVQTNLLTGAARVILADILAVISNRRAGHCVKVVDLPLSLIVDLCRQLRSADVRCEAYVLGVDASSDLYITSTKLVERRNVTTSVIVVFVPHGTRTSAEDFFDISTFESFPISNVYQRLRRQLLGDIPMSSRAAIEEIVRELGSTSDEDVCRFLLAI